MDNFKSFITEQKSESYRVVVISNDSTTAKRIGEEAKKLSAVYVPLFTFNSYMTFKNYVSS